MSRITNTTWCAACCMVIALPMCRVAAAGDRYWAWFRDGTHVTSDQLPELYAFDRPSNFAGRDLFDAQNPVRMIHDTSFRRHRMGPFVEMTNGDVLPGRVTGHCGHLEVVGMPEHFVVQVQCPEDVPAGPWRTVRVRAANVRRIVSSPKSMSHDYRPGLLRLSDGRTALARKISPTSKGIRALTESGVISADFREVAEVHFLDVDVIGDLLAESAGRWPTQGDPVVRIRTADGAQLTYRRSMVRSFGGKAEQIAIAIQPWWSLDAIVVRRSEIVFRTYRRAEEIPLSLLPGTQTQKQSAVHYWPWRRNANVQGSALSSGRLAADLGVGTHSRCRITFALPPGAVSFDTWAGIDRNMGNIGCVICQVHEDGRRDRPLFSSRFVRGGQPPLHIGPLDVTDMKALVLETDFGHEGRPEGATPFDIGDQFNWLMPFVTVEPGAVELDGLDLEHFFPALTDWRMSEETRRRISIRYWWNPRECRWQPVMVPDAGVKIGTAGPVELTRTIEITPANTALRVSAGRDRTDSTFHAISIRVEVAGRQVKLPGGVGSNAGPCNQHGTTQSLEEYLGKTVKLTLVIVPHGPADLMPAGIIWGEAQFCAMAQ